MCMRTIEQPCKRSLSSLPCNQSPRGLPCGRRRFLTKNFGIDSLQALEMRSRLENHFRIESRTMNSGRQRLQDTRPRIQARLDADLKKYNSVGEALRDALDTWPRVCLIESDPAKKATPQPTAI